jgi:prepilin-type N-terminal cleavage/methylation domain-containing protein/prepilin-type processing-associated H-X9-DG protein
MKRLGFHRCKALWLSGNSDTDQVLLVSKGFTLIELLVTTAIVGVLAALLLPALASSKQQAYKAKCIGNLRQLSVALQLYVSDQDYFPLATSGNGFGAWQLALLPSVTSNSFYCPQQVRAQPSYLHLTGSTEPEVLPHYGYNMLGAAWSGIAQPSLGLGGDFSVAGTNSSYGTVPQSRVLAPAEMIALGDSGGYVSPPLVKSADPFLLLYISRPYIIPTIDQPAVGNWHDGGANMFFCDGHCEYAKQSNWIAATDSARQRWNSDHQPHPEYWGGQ